MVDLVHIFNSSFQIRIVFLNYHIELIKINEMIYLFIFFYQKLFWVTHDDMKTLMIILDH
jgi:hypothetical protein